MKNTQKVTCADFDPNQYEGRWTEEQINSHQKHGKFLKFSILDISKYNRYDDELSNAAVRQGQNNDGAVVDIAYSYEQHGWDYDCFPPIISTKGNIMDGRTRILAAMACGWKYILVAIFSYDEGVEEKILKITNGLIANDHLVARRSTMNDFIFAGVHLVNNGYINRDQASIDDWLYNEIEIERFYNNLAGTITKISKAILAQSTNDGSIIVLEKDRSEWIEYLEPCQEIKNLDLVLPDESPIFGENQLCLYTTGRTNASRCWVDHVLSNVMKDYHTYIVLYSTEKTEEKVREGMKKFENDLERIYTQTFNLINNQLSGINLEMPQQRPFTIMGAIPQFAGSEVHDELRANNRLVPLKNL